MSDEVQPARRFFNGVAAPDLGIGDAISTAYRVLAKPGFVLPVVILAVIVSLTVLAAIGPLIRDRLIVGPDELEGRLSVLVSSGIVAAIGSLLAATYGQVWLVAATSVGEPTVGEALRRTVDRFLAVLGSGLIVGLIIGVPLVLVVSVAGYPPNLVILVLSAPLFVYLVARLSLATWLAADGRGPIESVRMSWQLTRGQLLRIIGWSLAYGIVIAIVAAIPGLLLSGALSAAIIEGATVAAEFGAGIVLYRKVEADAPEIERRERV